MSYRLPCFAFALLFLASASGQAQDDGKGVAPEDGIVLEGARLLVPNIPFGSWCEGGEHVLEEGVPVEVGSVRLSRDAKYVTLTGHFKDGKTKRKRQEYKPSSIRNENVEEERIGKRDIERGVDVEICDENGKGTAVIRVEKNWRGVVWGVVSGWEFQLDEETLTVIDADYDGACSESDRVIYGERDVWMPWHTVTAVGGTIYHELTPAGPGTLTARVRKMDALGADAADWNVWQTLRKDQGLPPGLFSNKLRQGCLEHANYCKLNKYQGHSQERGKPGYTAEGAEAASKCCIAYGDSVTDVMFSFFDSVYHRPQLIDPRDISLHIGGTKQCYMMGPGRDSELPSETRELEQALLSPAPGSRVPNGRYVKEWPEHPILSETKAPGLPVMVRLGFDQPVFSDVECHLYAVAGDARTGERGVEIRCHLSHTGKNTPPSNPNLWNMVVLTPYAPLKPGVYEADFKFTATGQEHAYHWRFTVGK